MPNPIATDLHVDQVHSEISVAYRNAAYIAWKVFQEVKSSKQSDLIAAYDQSHWFRSTATLRGRGSEAPVAGYKVNQDLRYFCDRVSQAVEVPEEDRDNQDDVWDVDKTATEFATDKIELFKEIKFVDDFFTTGVWGTDKTGGTNFTRWSDYGASKPEVDIDEWRLEVGGKVAIKPNVVTMGEEVWYKIKWHPNLVGAIENIQLGMITTDVFKRLFDLKDVLVGAALKTTAKLGVAEASVTYTRLWGKHLLLTYQPDRPGKLMPASGYCFWWDRVPASPGMRNFMRRWQELRKEISVFEANSYFDQKAVSTGSALFASGVVA